MSFNAAILADSITDYQVRLVTAMLTFPRFMLAELNTHRVFSRNSASSRAIPTEKQIQKALREPFVPETFNKRVKGMGVGDAFSPEDQDEAADFWLAACGASAAYAGNLNEIGVDKSRANRLLEPFMWHTAIITSTEWTNFFALRCPPDNVPDPEFPAQLEFQQIAILLREAMRNSEPQRLRVGEWHRPLVDVNVDGDAIANQYRYEEDDFWGEKMNALSARRLARVSYERHLDTEPVVVSIDRAADLVKSGHFSPTEHVARPLDANDLVQRADKLHVPISEVLRTFGNGDRGRSIRDLDRSQVWCGNLRGYFQYRKEFECEEDHSRLLDYEVM